MGYYTFVTDVLAVESAADLGSHFEILGEDHAAGQLPALLAFGIESAVAKGVA